MERKVKKSNEQQESGREEDECVTHLDTKLHPAAYLGFSHMCACDDDDDDNYNYNDTGPLPIQDREHMGPSTLMFVCV